jgi:exodeoxyribonuclease V alpha subunit
VVIRLLPPTGKASKRIEEQLGDREVEVSTIHKFIGYGKTFVTKEDVEEIKKSGLVVIDESSMMDVEIFRQLLSKLDMENTKVILVGDENQLPSIGAGNVLHDLIKMGVPTFRLTINHRNSGLIHTNAQKVISGEIGLESDEHFVVDERSPKMAWVFAGADINNNSIVVPYHKEDKIGSVPQVNAIAQERHRLASRQGAKYNIGDVVICTRNNYRNGYLNGDVGHYKGRVDECHEILIGDKTVSVLDSDLELGYAITIHKSQGSEYPVMSICLPEYSPFITRKMLYTAITRAKHKLMIYAKHTVINRIILNNKDDERRTFLGILL